MKQRMIAVLGTVVAAVLAGPVRADQDQDVQAVLNKAIKALGGEENLGKLKAATWKYKGNFFIEGNANKFSGQTTIQGTDHLRQEFRGEFMGNKVEGVTVISGKMGWRKFGDQVMELDNDAVANEKRALYLQMIPTTILPLKQKGFKVKKAGEEKIGGKPAVALKITAPDGKDFKLFFDKESGLPVKQVAKVTGFMGEDATQETTYANYKDMGGIQKATKTESKRDGQKFMEVTITEFKVVEKVDAKTFTEPK
jgi:hypothetical protein